MNVPFNIPLVTGDEQNAIADVIQSGRLCGNGPYNKKCAAWFQNRLGCKLAIPTPSCTSALEMGLMLAGVEYGDEVILPSFTFTSTATAVVMNGGVPVFIDSRPDTLNIDENLIEEAITDKTKVIMPMHYGSVSCDMDKIMALAEKHNLIVLEDAAQCVGARYNKRSVGSEGHMSAFSFHDTKNITCGEGGMLCINDPRYIENAEIVRDKGTNREQFFRGMVDKYSWQDKGSSFLISEIQAAYLSVQLEQETKVTDNRRETWKFYDEHLEDLEGAGHLQRMSVPEKSKHNAHLYYILLPTEAQREKLQTSLHAKGVQAVPHYVPLHSAPGGQKFGRTGSAMAHADDLPNRLLRLPLYYDMTEEQKNTVIQALKSFFK